MRTFTRPLRLLQALGSLRAGIPALGAALLCAGCATLSPPPPVDILPTTPPPLAAAPRTPPR